MRTIALLPVLALAACVEAGPPMVSDYNGETVKLISHPYPLGADYRSSPIYTKAAETCGREAVYQGTRQIGEYQGEHVFLCR